MRRPTKAVLLAIVALVALVALVGLGAAGASSSSWGGTSAVRAPDAVDRTEASQLVGGGSHLLAERPAGVAPSPPRRTLLRLAGPAVAAGLGLFVVAGWRAQSRRITGRPALVDDEHLLGTRHRGPPLRLA